MLTEAEPGPEKSGEMCAEGRAEGEEWTGGVEEAVAACNNGNYNKDDYNSQ